MPCAGASFWDTLPMSAPGASDAPQLFRNTESGAAAWTGDLGRIAGYALREPTMSLGVLCVWFGRQA